ncbi:MAG: hypothetical protein E7267_02730 [Lachnospiraceae bacterium]|nr:hypothetical protein [Lachnospiraceae bacterium]
MKKFVLVIGGIVILLGGIFLGLGLITKSKVIEITTKNELLELLRIEDLDCEIVNIQYDDFVDEELDHELEGVNLVVTIKASKSSIDNNENFVVSQEYDDSGFIHIFNNYFRHFSFTIDDFDVIGSYFNELVIKHYNGALYIPYELWWGITYGENDSCDVTIFTGFPRDIVIDKESILEQ